MPSLTEEQPSPWIRMKGGLKILAGGLSIGFPPATALLSLCGLGLMAYGGAGTAAGWIGKKFGFDGADKIMAEGLDAMTSGALLFVPYVGGALLMADGATNVISGTNKYGLVECAKAALNIVRGKEGYRFADFKNWVKKSISPVEDRRETGTSTSINTVEALNAIKSKSTMTPDNTPYTTTNTNKEHQK